MNSREVINIMIISETTSQQLYNQMNNYVEVEKEKVQSFINDGIHKDQKDFFKNQYELKVMSFLLGLKYHPRNWQPEKIERRIVPRQTVLGLDTDIVHKNHVQGEGHGNHAKRKKAVTKFSQTEKVDEMIERLGGRTKLADQLGIPKRMFSNWRTYVSVETGGRGTIPVKHHEKILQISDAEGLGITQDDLIIFKTIKKERKTNGKFCK